MGRGCPSQRVWLDWLKGSTEITLAIYCSIREIDDTPTLTRPSGTLSHRMGEGRGEGRFVFYAAASSML